MQGGKVGSAIYERRKPAQVAVSFSILTSNVPLYLNNNRRFIADYFLPVHNVREKS